MQTVGILVGVFAKTSSARSALACVCLFLLVCIQEMFLRGSQTASEATVSGGHLRFARVQTSQTNLLKSFFFGGGDGGTGRDGTGRRAFQAKALSDVMFSSP